jgi:hypothetical protein
VRNDNYVRQKQGELVTNATEGRLSDDQLIELYAEKIRPILSLAQRAYGSRMQDTPAHVASREYTRLLLEYTRLGGNLVQLAAAVGTTYGAMRRRVVTASAPPTNRTPGRRVVNAQTEAAVARLRAARKEGINAFHEQLAAEYDDGASLSAISASLGIKGSASLYYGMQRARSRAAEAEVGAK